MRRGAGAYGCLREEGRSRRYGNVRDAGAYAAAALSGRAPTAEEDDVRADADRNERLRADVAQGAKARPEPCRQNHCRAHGARVAAKLVGGSPA